MRRTGDSFETLYKKADDTLYFVKGTGKNKYAFYHDGAAMEQVEASEETADDACLARKGKKHRILIVDDSRIDCEMLANMFRDDYKIEKAMDGASALVKLHHYGSAISLVLLDLVMPGMDGFAVLEKMQRSADTKSIPVIVVTGSEDRDTCLRAIRAGAADFVSKPVDNDILRIRVASAISKSENERLRAQNSFLELQRDEMNNYKTVLEKTGLFAIAHDWVKGTFAYSPSVSKTLCGTYDSRSFWQILLSDLVADSQTVRQMQQLEHDVANDRSREDGRMMVRLKVASGGKHLFEMNVYKQANEFGLTDKLIFTFQDQDAKRLQSREA